MQTLRCATVCVQWRVRENSQEHNSNRSASPKSIFAARWRRSGLLCVALRCLECLDDVAVVRVEERACLHLSDLWRQLRPSTRTHREQQHLPPARPQSSMGAQTFARSNLTAVRIDSSARSSSARMTATRALTSASNTSVPSALPSACPSVILSRRAFRLSSPLVQAVHVAATDHHQDNHTPAQL